MKILGIDPGSTRVGWALIDVVKTVPHATFYGCISTEHITGEAERLSEVYNEMNKLLLTHKPDVLSIESLFFTKNAKTAISVAQSRGVILLSAHEKGIPVISYSPTAIKATITGSGKADKAQVQKMVKLTLHMTVMPKPDDTVDAIAIGLTHAYSQKFFSHSL